MPLVVATVLTAVLLLGGSSNIANEKPRFADTANLRQTEVVFVGFNHAYAFLQPETSPAHIRALLDRVNPAALCVENDADWPKSEGIPTYPHEQYAAITWAQSRRRPLYHVNWDDAEFAQARRGVRRMVEGHSLDTTSAGFQTFRRGYLARAQFSASLAFAEGEGAIGFERFQRDMNALSVEPDTGIAAVRDDNIASRILQAIRAHEGQRIAVVFGAGHYQALKKRLERVPGVRVVMPTANFPLPPEDVSRGWLPDDAVVLLGASLDDWRIIAQPHLRDHRRTLDLLLRLERERPDTPESRYFRARWVMLTGDLDSARVLLEKVSRSPQSGPIPYRADARWSWPPFRSYQEKAQFNLAVVQDLLGKREAAVAAYRALLDGANNSGPLPLGKWQRVDLRPYLESLLQKPYVGGLTEAYRAELAMGMAR
jgi:tetratricopeptide (TPR) repeat protein